MFRDVLGGPRPRHPVCKKLGTKFVSLAGVFAATGPVVSEGPGVVEILVGRPSSTKVDIVFVVKSTTHAAFVLTFSSLGP
jgi:hypothetical protein